MDAITIWLICFPVQDGTGERDTLRAAASGTNGSIIVAGICAYVCVALLVRVSLRLHTRTHTTFTYLTSMRVTPLALVGGGGYLAATVRITKIPTMRPFATRESAVAVGDILFGMSILWMYKYSIISVLLYCFISG